MTITTLLVGMHFHPPAKLVLEHLPVGCPFQLRAEPDNPYDEKAIGVWLRPSDIPDSQHEALRAELPLSGYDLDELLVEDELFIGHVAATGGKPLEKAGMTQGTLDVHEHGLPCEAKLGFSLDGKPLLIIPGPDQ